MNEVGDDFLARAAFAGNQNRNIAWRDAFDGADDILHGGASKNRRGRAAHGFERAAERDVFFALLFAVNGAFHVREQFFIFERLGEKIVSAAASGFDGHGDGAMSAQDDDFRFRPGFFDERQKIETVGVGQFYVDQNS